MLGWSYHNLRMCRERRNAQLYHVSAILLMVWCFA